MKNYIFLACIALSPVFMATSCKDNKGGNNKTNCEGVACTMMFAAINVDVNNSDGSAAQLDEVYTLRESTSEKLTFPQNTEGGMYTILDDSYAKELQMKQENFRFIGMKNGQKVVDEPYKLGADCCHVSRTSGKETITLP